jgi:hypothetical protein
MFNLVNLDFCHMFSVVSNVLENLYLNLKRKWMDATQNATVLFSLTNLVYWKGAWEIDESLTVQELKDESPSTWNIKNKTLVHMPILPQWTWRRRINENTDELI